MLTCDKFLLMKYKVKQKKWNRIFISRFKCFTKKTNFFLAKWLKNSLTYCWPRNKSVGSLITFTIGRVCRNNKYPCIIYITQISSFIASHYVVNYPPNHSLSLPNHPQQIIKIVNSYQRLEDSQEFHTVFFFELIKLIN